MTLRFLTTVHKSHCPLTLVRAGALKRAAQHSCAPEQASMPIRHGDKLATTPSS